MAHFEALLAVASPEHSATHIGLVDLQCNPLEICNLAIASVQSGLYPCEIQVETPCGEIRFGQSPRYLYFIMLELLNNAAWATCSAAAQAGLAQATPIDVVICANAEEVSIRVSDHGGG